MPKYGNGGERVEGAKARKEAKKKDEEAAHARAKEDASWEDDDPSVRKKNDRDAARRGKADAAADRKSQNKLLAQQEEEELERSRKPKQPEKVTRAEIEARKVAMQLEAVKLEEERKKSLPRAVVLPDEIEENPNQAMALLLVTQNSSEARSVGEALSLLSPMRGGAGREEEREDKYAEYERERIGILKEENPALRLSQLRQMIKKEWLRSPRNPQNSR